MNTDYITTMSAINTTTPADITRTEYLKSKKHSNLTSNLID